MNDHDFFFTRSIDLLCVAGFDGYFKELNRSWQDVLGFTADELMATPLIEFVHPEDRELTAAEANKLTGSVDTKSFLNRYRCKNGSYKWLSWTATGFPEQQKIYAIARDVTEIKLAREEELEASEKRYRQLFNSNPVPMWVYDIETLGFLAVNDAAVREYGYSREEFSRMTFKDVCPSVDPEAFYEMLSTKAEPRKRPGIGKHRKKDGSIIEVEVIADDVTMDGKSARLVSIDNVTEKRKLEAQLIRTQRLEGLGALAGGIAHDLNNALAPILMAVELLKAGAADDADRSLLDTLATSAKRGADIVRQVLTFARVTAGDRSPLQPAHVLRSNEKLLRETFPKSIQIQTEAGANLWMVNADPAQLAQVLLNVSLNSRDAMPNGGTLNIRAENVVVSEQYAGLNPDAKPGPYVMISIEDTGAGIPAEILDKVFDPFFTTKEVGKGTGLGLSTALTIVKSHGGFLKVTSEPGRGTQVRMYFPAKESAEMRAAGANQANLPHGAGQLILVVDDEEAMRRITKLTLELYNYRVVTAANGVEALSCYAQQSKEIKVVILDMMMPIMDGTATINALEAINPRVRVIAASGIIDRAQQAGSSSVVRALLGKPFTADTLLTTLHEVAAAER